MTSRRQVLILGCVAATALGQPPRMGRPTILKEPADWRFERMPVPPGFAPAVKLQGFEECRFAPGVFNNTSPNYFTYVLTVLADNAPVVNETELVDFLEKYYRGLSVAVGRQKGQSPDPAQMKAAVKADSSAPNRYTGTMTFFDSFTNGRKIALNLEIRVASDLAGGKVGFVFLVSPKDRDQEIWQKLREIGSKVTFATTD